MIKFYEYYVFVEKKTKKEYTLEDLQKKHRLPVCRKLWSIIKNQYVREIRYKFMEA